MDIKRQIQKYHLRNADNSIPLFSLAGKKYVGKVVDIYDGDSVKIVFYRKGKLEKFNCRLYGIDTPELRPSKSDPNREIEIKKAKQAKDFVEKFLAPNQYICDVECFNFDKYGRLLVKIWVLGTQLNHALVSNNLAKEYFGGKK